MSTPSSIAPSSMEPTTSAAPSTAPPTTSPPQTIAPATTTSPSTTTPPVTTTSSPPATTTPKPATTSADPSATPVVTSTSPSPSPRSSFPPPSTPQVTNTDVATWTTLPFTPPAPQEGSPDIQNEVADWVTTTSTPTAVPPGVSNPGNSQAMLIAIIACATLAVFLVAFFVILFVRRARRDSESDGRGGDEVFLGTPPPSSLNRRATHPRHQSQMSPRQRHHLTKLSPRSMFHHSGMQPTPTATSDASCTLPSPVDFSLDHGGVEYHNSFARSAVSNRSFAVDDIRDDDSAGSYRSDDTKGYFDLRLSTPASSDPRSVSFSYRITSPEAAPSSPHSLNSDLAMLDDGHRRSSGASSNFSIRVDSKDDDLVGSSCHDDQLSQLHDDEMKAPTDHRQDRRPSSVCSDMSSYHI